MPPLGSSVLIRTAPFAGCSHRARRSARARRAARRSAPLGPAQGGGRDRGAEAGVCQLGRTLAGNAERAPVLRARRYLHLDAAVDGRNLDLRAERRLRDRDGNIDRQIVALAVEDASGRDPRDDDQIARLAAPQARLALPGLAHTRTLLDSGPNLYLGALVLGDGGGPLAR